MSVWRDDKFASNYFGIGKSNLIIHFAVYPFVLHYLGNIEGKTLLDVACGEGEFCRLVKTKKASRVVGVDLCPAMIRNALEENNKIADCDIEFYQGDAWELNTIGQFDYITANLFFFWLDTINDVTNSCLGIYKNLKPGGRFVGTIVNTTVDPVWDNTLEKYGFCYYSKLPDDVNKFKGIIKGNHENKYEAVVNLFPIADYEQAFIKAGFSSFEIKETFVCKDVLEKFNDGFWDTYLSKPCIICIIANKL